MVRDLASREMQKCVIEHDTLPGRRKRWEANKVAA